MPDPFEIIEGLAEVPEAAREVDVEARLRDLHARCAQLENQLAADRRSAERSQADLLASLLDVADALDRIVVGSKENPAQGLERLHRNVTATQRLMQQKLALVGVARMELVGRPADPNLSDVEDEEENDGLPDETVIREIIPGYIWHGSVLRRAKVTVSRCP